jgi:hypothetical protein
MKGNIKKLTVLVIIVAIAMFFVWAMASAGGHKIRGVYSGTGGGTCIIAPSGFDAKLTPICGAAGTCAIVQWFSREADYTFENDGTGSMTGTGRVVAQIFSRLADSTYGHLYAGGPPYAGSAEANFEFKYTVDDSGTVTIEQKPGTYYFSEWTFGPSAIPSPRTFHSEGWEFTGSITPDGKGMNLASGVPVILTLQEVCKNAAPPPEFVPCPGVLPMSMICNFDTVLIRQHH